MQNFKKQAKLFKALSDENRLFILEMLLGNERCACMLLEELHISQSTLSHHMKILCDADIVLGRKEGKWMHYQINPEAIQEIMEYMSRFSVNTAFSSCNCQKE